MALKLIQHIAHGERMPLGYGVAWFTDWSRDRVVCMPVPFNVLARVLRDAWHYVVTISDEVPVNPRVAYLQGLAEGRASTYDQLADMGVQLGQRKDTP